MEQEAGKEAAAGGGRRGTHSPLGGCARGGAGYQTVVARTIPSCWQGTRPVSPFLVWGRSSIFSPSTLLVPEKVVVAELVCVCVCLFKAVLEGWERKTLK